MGGWLLIELSERWSATGCDKWIIVGSDLENRLGYCHGDGDGDGDSVRLSSKEW